MSELQSPEQETLRELSRLDLHEEPDELDFGCPVLSRRQPPVFQDDSSDDFPMVSSPKTMMICPQPRRIFTPHSLVPLADNPPDSPWSAHDEEAHHDLRELMEAPTKFFDGQQPLDMRPLSSVSTTAPSPDVDRAFTPAAGSDRPQSPILEEYNSDLPWGDGDDASVVALGQQRCETPDIGKDKGGGLSAQVRKIFVGGIPQTMNQDDLYTIFGQYAGVKKAWLQRHRTAGPSYPSPPRNHRGFGFVIFNEANAVEKILGSSNSQFIVLNDGRKLEVKRAVSSNEMTTPSAAPPPSSSSASSPQPASHDPPAKGQQEPPVQQSPKQPAASSWSAEAPWAGAGVAMPTLPFVPSLASLATGAGTTTWSGGTVLQAQQAAYSSVPGLYMGNPQPRGIFLQPRGDMAEGDLLLQAAGQPQILLAPTPDMCDGGAMVQQHALAASAQAHVSTSSAVPPVQSPQPVLSWAPAAVVASPWATSATAAAPSQRSQSSALHWAQGQAEMCTVASSASLADEDQPVLADNVDASGGAGDATSVVLPEGLLEGLLAPESQQSSFRNYKELESALLQAMPEYYDD